MICLHVPKFFFVISVMPRVYKRKLGSRRYMDYRPEDVARAVQAVRRGLMNKTQAADTFGIPRRTLSNKLQGAHTKKSGGQISLTEEMERTLVDVLIAAAEYGSPLTMLDLRMVVKSHLDLEGITISKFIDNTPGKEWCLAFLKRHKQRLTNRTCQNIKRNRAEKTEEEMNNYFDNLQQHIMNIPPERILNYDETNVTDDPGAVKCIFHRGSKYPERIMNSTKSSISIMFAATASGDVLPPYVVYKAERLYDQWCIGGPHGCRYNRTKSGWFDHFCFEDWFEKIVVPWAKTFEGPKMVIGDNLSSHLNVTVLRTCQQHNIRFTFLPPSSTHLTQPLDVGYFHSLKTAWRSILTNYKLQNPRDKALNKSTFPTLLKLLMDKMQINNKDIIKNAFKAAGIYPLNRNQVLKRMPKKRVDERITGSIDKTLLQYLEEKRRPNTDSQLKRKKMLNVVPGRSVSLDDIEEMSAGPSNVKKSKQDPVNKQKYDLDSEELTNTSKGTVDENVVKRNAMPLLDVSSDEDDYLTLRDDTTLESDNSSNENATDTKIEKNDFVVVRFQTKKTTKYYIGNILQKDDDFFKVKFLRRKTENKFVFPVVDDISDVHKSEFMIVLPTPKCPSSSRDIFTFNPNIIKSYNLM